MDSKEFLTSYLNDFSNLVKPDKDIVHKLVEVAELLKDVHADRKKTLIFGNGGSAAMASHVSVDLTKNAGYGSATAVAENDHLFFLTVDLLQKNCNF